MKRMISLFLILGLTILLSAACDTNSPTPSDPLDTDPSQETTAPENTGPISTLDPDAVTAEYKASCQTIDYETLASNPEKYEWTDLTFTGEVTQVYETDQGTILRLHVAPTDALYAEVYIPHSNDRILEGDIITIWGMCTGLVSYETISGSQESLPGMNIEYYELIEG